MIETFYYFFKNTQLILLKSIEKITSFYSLLNHAEEPTTTITQLTLSSIYFLITFFLEEYVDKRKLFYFLIADSLI